MELETDKKQRRENVVAGVVGAFLGTLVGVLCTVIIGQLGYVASVSGLIMAVGALKGYELLGGTLSKKGAVISCVFILIMTYLAHRLTLAFAVTSALSIGVFDSFQLVPALVSEGILEARAYWGDLALLYLFTLLGAVPTILGGLRASSLPDLPPAPASTTLQDGGRTDAAFYPGQVAWMRPLRLTAALSMLVGLVPGIGLLFYSIANGDPMAFTMAALGCILSSFVMMCFALPQVQLCYGAMALMVRSGGVVWKVMLPMLNGADTYRFSKKAITLRAIRWEILDGSEQERAKSSIQRAIALLSSGQVMPGSALSMAVQPLTDLTIDKETPWGWKGAYSVSNGRWKKISIPKAYPNFAPVPGMEPVLEPVPARWGLLGLAAALALILGLIGFSFGLML